MILTIAPEVSQWNSFLTAVFPFITRVNRETLIQIILAFIIFWIVLEMIFGVIVLLYVSPHLQKRRKPFVLDAPCPYEYFKRIFDSVDLIEGYTIEKYLSGFFHGADIKDIYQDNVRSFISWAMVGKHLEDLSERERLSVERVFGDVLARYPQINKLASGFNSNVSHCAITLEPVPFIHRPLFLYVATGIMEMLFNLFYLRMSGFQFLEADGINYWLKMGPPNCTLPPLLIFHGISPGWSLYGLLIRTFAVDRTVILADLDAIKIKSMFFYMPSRIEYTNSIVRVLKRHRIDKVSIVGHSFGSITSTWLLDKHPEVVCHVTLLDPVSLLLSLPDVVESFIYRKPRTFSEYLIYYFASREVTISYALHRNFCWHANAMYLDTISEDIGMVIGLSTKDEITNPAAQNSYIKHFQNIRKEHRSMLQKGQDPSANLITDITIVNWKGYLHGQVLLNPSALAEYKRIVNTSEKLSYKQQLLS